MTSAGPTISRRAVLLLAVLVVVCAGGWFATGRLSGDVAAAPTTPVVDGPSGPRTRSATAIAERLAGSPDVADPPAPATGAASDGVPKHTPQAARSDADTVLAQMQACFATVQNYAGCDEPDELGRTGLALVQGRDPRPGQVSVKGRGDRLLIRAADSLGQLWQITASAETAAGVRVCVLADASGPCRVATW